MNRKHMRAPSSSSFKQIELQSMMCLLSVYSFLFPIWFELNSCWLLNKQSHTDRPIEWTIGWMSSEQRKREKWMTNYINRMTSTTTKMFRFYRNDSAVIYSKSAYQPFHLSLVMITGIVFFQCHTMRYDMMIVSFVWMYCKRKFTCT